MGEYIGTGKKQVKLGTCESLYYTTFEQLKKSKFKESEKESFLKLDSGYRFRFPFPDEKIEIGTHENYDRGFLFKLPKELKIELGHGKRFIRVGFDRSESKHYDEIGIEIPCPFSEKFSDTGIKSVKWHNDLIIFEIIQQKYTTAQGAPMLVTVARCPYCGNAFQLSKDEIITALDYFLDYSKESTNEIEILSIALQGYNINEISVPAAAPETINPEPETINAELETRLSACETFEAWKEINREIQYSREITPEERAALLRIATAKNYQLFNSLINNH